MVKSESSKKTGVGIFGGTFNPIHLGHLIIAENSREKLNLKKIIFVPSCYPPHKKTPEIGASHRYQMAKLAISPNPYFVLSAIEVKRKNKSYTIDTIRALKKLYSKEKNFYFILGLDAYLAINTWKDIEKLAGLVKFVVVKRPGYQGDTSCQIATSSPPLCFAKRSSGDFLAMTPKFKNVKFLDLGPIGISSTEIRKRIKEKKSVRYLLPKNVMDYIFQHHLYE